MSEITDANQMRGSAFRDLLKKLWIWALIVGLAIAAGVAAGVYFMPLGGGIAAVAVLIFGLVCVFAYADHLAEQAFFDAYAKYRGLTRSQTQLGNLTPLLSKGDSRQVEEMFTGKLDDDVEGSLALYKYTIESRDSDGDKTETDYPFTLVVFNLPGTTNHLAELLVQAQSGFKAWEGLEDKFRGGHERVTLESEAMRDRYEIFIQEKQDPIWVRRLFSPTFIVWLTEKPPKKFAFELVAGTLVTYVPKHRDSVEGLDEIIAAGCEVARRLNQEVAESN
jgi:hypothetical protein